MSRARILLYSILAGIAAELLPLPGIVLTEVIFKITPHRTPALYAAAVLGSNFVICALTAYAILRLDPPDGHLDHPSNRPSDRDETKPQARHNASTMPQEISNIYPAVSSARLRSRQRPEAAQ